jgi:putative transposase
MRNVRRYFKEGRIYFFTHVTYQRQPILITHIDLLWNSIHKFKQLTTYELIAWVILPDHWHCLIGPLDNDVASPMKRVKLSFAAGYLKRCGLRSGRTWHNRYWDHIIRDQEDMNRHLDYIHYNPVRHGLVASAMEYPHSSFRQFVDNGLYDSTWGSVNSPTITGEFGE